MMILIIWFNDDFKDYMTLMMILINDDLKLIMISN